MESTVQLVSAAEALAALTAHVRVRTETLAVDPEVASRLADVATQLLGTAEITASDPAAQVVGMARALLREALALIEDPGRSGAWHTVDESVLQGLGRLSMSIAGVFATLAGQLDGLGAALARPGAALLDVGTGTGWLAIATARAFPAVHVTGIDIFDTALGLAAANVRTEQLTDRVTLRRVDVTALEAESTFDAIWLPLPFLPRAVVPAAVARCVAVLRPGGWLLAGQFDGPPDPLSQALTELRTVRSGGYPWPVAELTGLLDAAGLDPVAVTRTWAAPMQMIAAQAPTTPRR